MNETGDQGGIGKQEYVCSEDFWVLCKTDGLGCNGDNITSKDR